MVAREEDRDPDVTDRAHRLAGGRVPNGHLERAAAVEMREERALGGVGELLGAGPDLRANLGGVERPGIA